MASAKINVTQSGANVDGEVLLPTLLTVDGKSGWLITGVKFSIGNLPFAVIPTADCQATMELNTETGLQSAIDKDCICIEYAAFSGIAASTSSYQVQTTYNAVIPEGRLTVQPNLYLHISTVGFSAALNVICEVFYEVVKLTDMEVMRLLQGGA
jgi:hypothetical protein